MSLDTNVAESILQAIDIISTENLNKLSFDKTIECEIVDNSNAKNGQYRVSDGSTRFDAYSEKTSYNKGARVLVKIPGGDYGLTKYIEGLVEQQNGQPITYQSPSNTMMEVFDLTKKKSITYSNSEYGFGLSSKNDKTVTRSLWTFNFNTYSNVWMDDIYTALYFEADFKTALVNSTGGTYGITLRVTTKLPNGDKLFQYYSLNSQDFFGNPYNFPIFSKQSKKINIKDFRKFEQIDLYFFQKDFKTTGAAARSSTDNLAETKNLDLFVKNIKVSLGIDLADVQDNTIKLVSFDPSSYDIKNKDTFSDSVNLNLLWLNKTAENTYVGFSDGVSNIKKQLNNLTDEDENKLKIRDILNVKTDIQDLKDFSGSTKQYSEDKYNNLVKADSRLIAQQNSNMVNDQISLEIMADVQDAHNALVKIKDLVTRYNNAFTTLKNNTHGSNFNNQEVLNDFELNIDLTNFINGNLLNGDSVNSECSFLKYYQNLYKYISFLYNSLQEEPLTEYKNIERILPEDCILEVFGEKDENGNLRKDFYTQIKGAAGNTIKESTYLTKFEKILDHAIGFEDEFKKNYSNYVKYYNVFKQEVEKIKTLYDSYIESVEKLKNIKISWLSKELNNLNLKVSSDAEGTKNFYVITIKDKISYTYDDYYKEENEEWEQSDKSIYDNLYCIYWYRYEKDYEDLNDVYGSKDWKRIDKLYSKYIKKKNNNGDYFYEGKVKTNDKGNEITIANNLGLPSSNGEYWHALPQENDEVTLNIILNPEKIEEKFKVVIIYNHEKFESNEITFKNIHHPNNEDTTPSGVIDILNYRNSQDHYGIYSPLTFGLLNSNDSNVLRELKANYKLELKENSETDYKPLKGYIYWYFPTVLTQLEFAKEEDYRKEYKEESGKKYFEGFNFQQKIEILKDAKIYKIVTVDNDKKFTAVTETVNGKTENKLLSFNSDDSGKNIYEIIENQTLPLKDSNSESEITCSKIKIQIDNEFEEIWIQKNKNTKISFTSENGWVCFSKKLAKLEEKTENNKTTKVENAITTQDDLDKLLTFPYRIKSQFDYDNINNVIKCEIQPDGEEVWSGNKGFTFDTFGSNGTDYTLSIHPLNSDITSFIGKDKDNVFQLEATVYNKNGNKVTISEDKWNCEFIGPTQYQASIQNGIIDISLTENTNIETKKIQESNRILELPKTQINNNKEEKIIYYQFQHKNSDNKIDISFDIIKKLFYNEVTLIKDTYEKNKYYYKPENGIKYIINTTDYNSNLKYFEIQKIKDCASKDLKRISVKNSTVSVIDKPSEGWNTTHENYYRIQDLTFYKLTKYNTTTSNFYGILKVKATLPDGDITLNSLYPIAWSSNNQKLSGPDRITYNSQGILNNYDKTPYQIYDNLYKPITEKLKIVMGYISLNETQIDIKYQIDGNIGSLTLSKLSDDILKYLPIVKQSDNSLSPKSLFVNNIDYYPVVQFFENNKLIFNQPIIIQQNTFESSFLNNWDGSLQIDEDNNTIMAAMIGAGVKEQDNSFSGVLMGDVRGKAGLASSGIGIYGFHEGGQSFGFNVDGTAFLGKSGKGRIEFDGNSGVIKSAFWDGTINSAGKITKTGKEGMAISLETGHIDAHDFKLSSSNVNFDSTATEGQPWMNVGDENTYIKFLNGGSLKIRVTDLDLTYHVGENLLINTAPLENENELLTYENVWYSKSGELQNIFQSKNNENEEVSFYTKYSKGNEVTDKKLISICNIREANNNEGFKKLWAAYDGNENTPKLIKKDAETVEEYETFYEMGTYLPDNVWKVRISQTDDYVLPQKDIHYKESEKDKKKKCLLKGVYGIPELVSGTQFISKSMYDEYFYEKNDKLIFKQDIWTQTENEKTNANNFHNNKNVFNKYYLPTVYTGPTSKRKCIRIAGKTNYSLYQDLSKTLSKNNYVLSGKGYANSDATITFRLYNSEKYNSEDSSTYSEESVEITKNYWENILIKFENIKDNSYNTLQIIGEQVNTENLYTLFYQLKLEEGLIATPWCQSTREQRYADKQKNNAENSADIYVKELNDMLDTNAIFNRLTDNGKKQGLFSEDGKLMINAECIGVGLLRSNDVEGTFYYNGKTDGVDLNYYESIVAEYAGKIIVNDIDLTKGTLFDLRSGIMIAHKFKLDAWNTDNGLYLNSMPKNTEDYLRIGDLNSGYISFSRDKKLKIIADEFNLSSGSLSNSNLLKNTAPMEGINKVITDWEKDPKNWKPSNSFTNIFGGYSGLYDRKALRVQQKLESDHENTPTISAKDSSNYRGIYQECVLAYDKTYTLSGEFLTAYKNYSNDSGVNRKIELRIYDGTLNSDYLLETKIIDIEDTGVFQKFNWTFKFTNDKTNNSKSSNTAVIYLALQNTGNWLRDGTDYVLFYHLKLENGSKATPWLVSEEDVSDYINNYDLQLNQDLVFNKLTNNGTTKGIFLVTNDSGKKELYINATYIASSILRSSNWEGKYQLIDSNKNLIIDNEFNPDKGYYNYLDLEKLLEKYPYAKLSNIEPEQGMYINLNDGKIWAKDLEIDAWNKRNNEDFYYGLYLNSNPPADGHYLKVGNSNNYIQFTQDGSLDIAVTNFKLTYASGENLLVNTEPLENVGSLEMDSWTYSPPYEITNINGTEKIEKGFQVHRSGTYKRKTIRFNTHTGQKVLGQILPKKLEQTKYILSGKIWVNHNGGKEKKAATVRFYLGDQNTGRSQDLTIPAGTSNWKDINLIFDLEGLDNQSDGGKNDRNYFQIIDNTDHSQGDSNKYTVLYHLKLERGETITPWCQSNYEQSTVDNLDSMLDQENVFNRLTNNGTVKGIWLENNQLYINATYIATGTLSSENNNMKINLNSGKIWAKNFELDAWDDDDIGGVYLNNDPAPGTSYFRIGDSNNYLRYYKNNDGNNVFKIKGNIIATSGEIGGCTIKEIDGKPTLKISSANIDNLDSLEIDAKQITSGTISTSRIDLSNFGVADYNPGGGYAKYLTLGIKQSSTDDLSSYLRFGSDSGGSSIRLDSGSFMSIYSGGGMTIDASNIAIKGRHKNDDGYSGKLEGTWTVEASIGSWSDKNKKNTIELISSNYDKFFDLIIPVTYKYNDGTSDRLHTGFIAQDIEEALKLSNISTKNFAGLMIASKKIKENEEEIIQKNYYLRYEEFISLNTWQIQKLKTRVLELENKILELEKNINK